MTHQKTYSDSAQIAYDAFAPVYDEFNRLNDYEVWLGAVLLPELEKHGLTVGRVLDVGCGTGKAFKALTDRGWQIVGCDQSEGMLAQAFEKLGGVVPFELERADARHLPFFELGGFDLILLLNDVVNYLTEDGDLERCFSGVARNLAPGGLVCFDTNSLMLMRNNFAGGGMDRDEWTWRGEAETVMPGETYEAIVSGPGIPDNVHRQRHWTEDEIRSALEASGLTSLARLGHFEGDGRIVLNDPADEERDLKVIYIAGHRGE